MELAVRSEGIPSVEVSMGIGDEIEARLAALEPSTLRVINESDDHAGPPGRESHFRVFVVSSHFDGLKRVQRHRKINALLRELMDRGLHALAIEARTPAEESERGASLQSPPCASTK